MGRALGGSGLAGVLTVAPRGAGRPCSGVREFAIIRSSRNRDSVKEMGASRGFPRQAETPTPLCGGRREPEGKQGMGAVGEVHAARDGAGTIGRGRCDR